jgi:hypothetical protein
VSLLGFLGQRGARGDRPVHRVLPGVVLGQHDRQLDHLFELQLLRRHAVQDVGVEPRRRRELDDRGRVHPRLHLARQAGDGVVRLVHDHQRPVDMHQVGEGELHAAAFQRFQPRQGLGQRREVRLHVLVVGIDLAALGVRDAQRLDRAHDDAAMVADVVRADMREVRDVEHAHPAVEGLVQRLPIGVAGVLQRLGRLKPDRVRRHQPQDHRIVLLHPGVARDADGVGAEDRLAAPGGQAQADIGNGRQLGERRVGAAVPAEPLGLVRLPGDRLVRALRARHARLLEKSAENGESIGLVLLQFHQMPPQARALTS